MCVSACMYCWIKSEHAPLSLHSAPEFEIVVPVDLPTFQEETFLPSIAHGERPGCQHG